MTCPFGRSPLPVDEGESELRFEFGDVRGDVRLHGVQRPGCAREASMIAYGGEGCELAEVHHKKR